MTSTPKALRLKQSFIPVLFLACVFLVGCNKSHQTEKDVDIKAKSDSQSHENWEFHGHSPGEQRFSPLSQVSTENVKDLKLAWYFDLPNDGGMQATPIVVDGVIYVTAAWSRVYALNAETGKLLWTYDPQVQRASLVKACCGPVNRGVAYSDGKVFVATLDGRLIGIDADSGKELWSAVTVDQSRNYTITGAPRVARGKVYIGNGGGEFGVRGYMSAYDANTGKQLWRFYTVPGNPDEVFENEAMAMAAKTWYGEWWKVGGGGTVWDSMAYDAELNLLYIGVGNGSPWNPNIRSEGKGDNLFLSSIVALNADTGDYVWHYQTTPGDGWDYTATQHMILADIEIDNSPRKVLMQAPKNGFFYVLDRQTGEFISAEPYAEVNWASHVDKKTGRPQINDAAKYWESGENSFVLPGSLGAHTWHPMAFDPRHQTVFIPAQVIPQVFKANNEEDWADVGMNLGIDVSSGDVPLDPENISAIKRALKGRLLAWDPVEQKPRWQVDRPLPNIGGLLATQGDLLFQGTMDGVFRAYNSIAGAVLWEFDSQAPVMAAPSSYSIGEKQHIAIGVGGGGVFMRANGIVTPKSANQARLLVFSLDGKASLPQLDEEYRQLPDTSHLDFNETIAQKGINHFARYCSTCHGASAVSGSSVPDLRYSGFMLSKEAWKSVVINGALSDKGMVSFAQALTEDDAEAIRQYVIRQNRMSREYGDTRKVRPYRLP